MSFSQKQSPPPKRLAAPTQLDTPAVAQPTVAAENSLAPHLDSPSHMISPASSTSVEVMPSNALPSDTPSSEESIDRQVSILRQQPIPPASEPMQYRAIGLIEGRYDASAEQFTRGMLVTEDGTAIDAVLLGRVMSLVKKHLDLTQSHLWVVYPRTRNKISEEDNDLHMQIVGVWEPENLASVKAQSVSEAVTADEAPIAETKDAAETAKPAETAETAETVEAPEPQDGYFSIRGEVLFYSAEEKRLIVKIQQSPRPGSDQGKMFKLNLNGVLAGNKSVGYFWDLQVQRQENLLVVQDGSVIGLVPPKKRKGGSGQDRRRSGGQGSFRGPRPARTGDRSPSHSENRSSSDRGRSLENRPMPTPPTRREPVAKPIKRPKSSEA